MRCCEYPVYLLSEVGYCSFEPSMATSGQALTMGDNSMMDMVMQCQHMIQECMLLQHMVRRTLCTVLTSK